MPTVLDWAWRRGHHGHVAMPLTFTEGENGFLIDWGAPDARDIVQGLMPLCTAMSRERGVWKEAESKSSARDKIYHRSTETAHVRTILLST